MELMSSHLSMHPKVLFAVLSLAAVDAAPVERRTLGLFSKKMAMMNSMMSSMTGNSNNNSNENSNSNSNNSENAGSNQNAMAGSGTNTQSTLTTTNLCNGMPCGPTSALPCLGGSCGMRPQMVMSPPMSMAPPMAMAPPMPMPQQSFCSGGDSSSCGMQPPMRMPPSTGGCSGRGDNPSSCGGRIPSKIGYY